MIETGAVFEIQKCKRENDVFGIMIEDTKSGNVEELEWYKKKGGDKIVDIS